MTNLTTKQTDKSVQEGSGSWSEHHVGLAGWHYVYYEDDYVNGGFIKYIDGVKV